MSNKRIDELPASPGLLGDSLFECERDPGGTKAHEKLTGTQLVNFFTSSSLVLIDTTADLKAIATPSDEKIYAVLGNITFDDGASRFYRYDPLDAQIENGLLVLIPTIIIRPATGSFIKLTF